jgi:hypothetical protein
MRYLVSICLAISLSAQASETLYQLPADLIQQMFEWR